MDKMSTIWVTVPEAAAALGVSDKTIRRRIKEDKFEVKHEGRRLLVRLDNQLDIMTDKVSKDEVIADLRSQIGELKAQLKEKDEQLKIKDDDLRRKDEHSEQSKERADTIILQLTRQLEQSQRLLEYHQEPWYRRILKRRSKPEMG